MNVGSEHSSHTHKDPLTALAIGVSSSVDLSVREQERAEAAPQKTKKKNRATLSKWAELEECAALCQYSCLLPCRFNRIPLSPLDIRRLIRNQMVAPQNSVGIQISNERTVGCAHTHTRPTHSPSNSCLFLGRSLRRGTRKSRGRAQRNDRATLSKWVELRNVLRSVNTPTRIAL